MKRTLSLVLAIAMVLSMMATGLVSQAASFSDTASHWAKSDIDYMVSYGVLNGYPNGTFKPDSPVKKSEFIKMMNYSFGLRDTSYRTFADVRTSDWFYADIQKAAANGYLTTNGSYVSPEGYLTRQEAAQMLANYLKLETSYSNYSFRDSAQIAAGYRNAVMACVAAGIFKGDNYGNFNPNSSITRGEAVTVLRRIIGTFVNNSSTSITTSDAAITQSGVSLYGAIISGDLLITEGAENGVITLQNTTVYGNVKLKGAVTLKLVNSSISSLVTETDGASSYITASGTSKIGSTNLKTPAVITNDCTSDAYGFTTINVNSGAGTQNSLSGNYKTVNVATPSTTLSLARGAVVEELNIAATATNTDVIGDGKAEQLNINASGAEVKTAPSSYKIASGVSAIIAGVTRTGTGAGASTGTYPKLFVLSGNTVEIKNYTSYSGRTYWMAVRNSAPAPSAAQIKNGTYGTGYNNYVVDSGSFIHYAGQEGSDTTIALTTDTYYNIYYYTEYLNSYSSAGSVEYQTVRMIASPVISYLDEGVKTNVDIYGNATQTVTVRSNNYAATPYVVAVPRNLGYSAPTASEVYEAANGVGDYLTSYMVTASGYNTSSNQQVVLSGLKSNYTYDVYVVLAYESGYTPVLSARNGTTSTQNALISRVASSVTTGKIDLDYYVASSGYVFFKVVDKGLWTQYGSAVYSADSIRSSYNKLDSNTTSGYKSTTITASGITAANASNYVVLAVVGTASDVVTPLALTTGTSSTLTLELNKSNVSAGEAIVATINGAIYDKTGAQVTASTAAATLAEIFTVGSEKLTITASYNSATRKTVATIAPADGAWASGYNTLKVAAYNSSKNAVSLQAIFNVGGSTVSNGYVSIKVEDATGTVSMGSNNTYEVYAGDVKVTLTSSGDKPQIAIGADVDNLTWAAYNGVETITVKPNEKVTLSVKYASGTVTKEDGTVETSYTINTYHLNSNAGSDPVVTVTKPNGDKVALYSKSGNESVYVVPGGEGVYTVTINADGAKIEKAGGDWDVNYDATKYTATASSGIGTNQYATVCYTVGDSTEVQTIKIIAMPELTTGVRINGSEVTASGGTYSVNVMGTYALDGTDYIYINQKPGENLGATNSEFKYQVSGSSEVKTSKERNLYLSDIFGVSELKNNDKKSATVKIWYEKEGLKKETSVSVSITSKIQNGQVSGVGANTASLTQGKNAVVDFKSATTITEDGSTYSLGFSIEKPAITKENPVIEIREARVSPNLTIYEWGDSRNDGGPITGDSYEYNYELTAQQLKEYAGEDENVAKWAGDIISYARIDWDNDGTWDQYVTLKIDPTVITLKDSSGTQVYPVA